MIALKFTLVQSYDGYLPGIALKYHDRQENRQKTVKMIGLYYYGSLPEIVNTLTINTLTVLME